jgi:hypothetical protein
VPAAAGKTSAGPWSISLAADGAGERFTGRDGGNPGAGLRAAGKFEWKGTRSSLFKLDTTVRGPGLDENFNRSSSGVYYRFPAPAAVRADTGAAAFPLRVSRISFGADRNAANPRKVLDSIDGTLGLSLNLPAVPLPGFSQRTGGSVKGSPLGISLSTLLKGQSSIDEVPLPYPVPQSPWTFDSVRVGYELSWSPGIFQFKTKLGYTAAEKKEEKWDTSLAAAIRFKAGRLGIKAGSNDFPDKWNWSISWRLEKK